MRVAYFSADEWERAYVSEALEKEDIGAVFFEGTLEVHTLPDDRNFDALCVFVDSSVNEEVIDAFPKLRLIATRSTGFDHIDAEACKERGIAISNVPTYGENTVAEYAFGLMLALSRRIAEGYDRLRETGLFSPKGLRGFDLKGKTLGVVGTGHIGMHVVRIAKGFDMKVVAHDPYPKEKEAAELGFSYAPFEELLGQSDIVTLHVPYTDETHHLLNQKTFAMMKPGAYLINTCRGAVVDTQALVEALHTGMLAGAALDVLEEEGAISEGVALLVNDQHEHDLRTVIANHTLIDLPNVIVTPHNAFNTKEAIMRIIDATVANLAGFKGGEPRNVVTSH